MPRDAKMSRCKPPERAGVPGRRISKPRELTGPERDLKRRIVRHMAQNGFQAGRRLRLPREDREAYREVQQRARLARIREHGKFLAGFLPRAREIHRDGREIVPEDIDLELRAVAPGSFESKLFFWWNLAWWSVPYQQAYGRQVRLLLWDRAHGMPFGLVQLQSPLLRMGARDAYLQIPKEGLDLWANMSMSAQRIGALPPYNALIGGKMAALAVTCNEVRDAYRERYGGGRETLMGKRVLEPDLLFVTTTGAFGKSSMYDRLRYRDRPAAVMIGHTRGTGTFHVPDGLARELCSMLEKMGVDTRTGYGHGPSRKVRLLRMAFGHLGLNGFHAHGIRRAVYLFPLAENLGGVIRGGERPQWFDRPFGEVAAYWKERWAVPRSRRKPEWKEFDSAGFFRNVAGMVVGA